MMRGGAFQDLQLQQIAPFISLPNLDCDLRGPGTVRKAGRTAAGKAAEAPALTVATGTEDKWEKG